ncbi:hypothetical protein MTO96_004724 [Rhipicephalus appendiculatus]
MQPTGTDDALLVAVRPSRSRRRDAVLAKPRGRRRFAGSGQGDRLFLRVPLRCGFIAVFVLQRSMCRELWVHRIRVPPPQSSHHRRSRRITAGGERNFRGHGGTGSPPPSKFSSSGTTP